MTAQAMHKQYSDGVTAFRQHIANPAMRQMFNAGADEFLRRCALGVWQADGGRVTPQHVEWYNAIYCKGNPVPSVLFWELGTAVAEYPGFQPPAFFQKMMDYDKAYRQSTARRFVDLMTLMLLLFAAVDGAVSDREAGFVNACADALSALCDADGLPDDKPRTDAQDFVTRKGEAPKEAATPAPAQAAGDKPQEEAPPADWDTRLDLEAAFRALPEGIQAVAVLCLLQERKQREAAFAGYCVDEKLMAQAKPDAMVQHCLPAHRGEEITEEVFEANAAYIFEEAENRLHAQKAVLVKTMGGEQEP